MINMNSYINDHVQLIKIQIHSVYLRLIVNKGLQSSNVF